MENKADNKLEWIKVYSRQGCGQCMFTKKWLEDNGFGDIVEVVDLKGNRDAMKFVGMSGFTSLPVVELSNGHKFEGFNREELNKLKEQ